MKTDIHSKAYQPGCLFCQFARQEKEVQFFAHFTHCYVIKDRFPVSNGHLLIIPHEHTDNWFTAKEEVRLMHEGSSFNERTAGCGVQSSRL